MSGEDDLDFDPGLDAFLGDVSTRVQHEMSSEDIEPNFEGMLARASAIAEATVDPELDAFITEVAGQLADDETRNEGGIAPDFLAVVARAHALDPSAVPEAAVEEVGHYAPIISLRDAARLRGNQVDAELDDFVSDVRGHLDHALAASASGGSSERSNAAPRRRGFGLAVAAGLLLAVGLGAGLATYLGGGHLWRPADDHQSEAMLSPQPAPTRESEVLPEPKPEPTPEPEPSPPEAAEDVPEEAPEESEPEALQPPTRPKARAKQPSRRDRLAALEQQANAAWRAAKLDDAEDAFLQIIALDPRGSWGETAYGELFTLQRQRNRSSVALWKAYLKRFPTGRFADDAQAGLCRRAEGEAKVTCWNDYLEAMPRGSFRRQALREIEEASP